MHTKRRPVRGPRTTRPVEEWAPCPRDEQTRPCPSPRGPLAFIAPMLLPSRTIATTSSMTAAPRCSAQASPWSDAPRPSASKYSLAKRSSTLSRRATLRGENGFARIRRASLAQALSTGQLLPNAPCSPPRGQAAALCSCTSEYEGPGASARQNRGGFRQGPARLLLRP